MDKTLLFIHVTADQRCKIEALACQKPENSERPINQWTVREIAAEVMKRKIVDDKISAINSAYKEAPELAKSFKWTYQARALNA